MQRFATGQANRKGDGGRIRFPHFRLLRLTVRKKAGGGKRNAQVGNVTQRGRRECGRAAAIAPKLLSASLDGAARGSKVSAPIETMPHENGAE